MLRLGSVRPPWWIRPLQCLCRRLAVPPEDCSKMIGAQPERLDSGQLRRLSKQFRARSSVRDAAQEYGIEGLMLARTLRSFANLISSSKLRQESELLVAVETVMAGEGHIDDLFPHYLAHVRDKFPSHFSMPELRKISDLTNPAAWFPAARAMPKRKLIYHAGPTNSGKTHHALQHFLAAPRAIYCAPLRMLAHEIYERANKQGVPCDLLTGKERQWASGNSDHPATHLACTVEMSTVEVTEPYDVAVVDEVQMLADNMRGGAWTQAILGLPARELHLCGHECAAGLVRRMVESVEETVEVKHYDRLAPLYPLERSLNGHYRRVRTGDCVVVFSRSKVFKVRDQIEQVTGHRCAVIYGALPPATRVEQAALFNNADSGFNVLVATDAIGMGLNLNIRRVLFHDLVKFDGQQLEPLSSGHTKQIAGRAGRYGLKHPEGEVSTFFNRDLALLHQKLQVPEEEIQHAGIYPTSEQIKLFSDHLPSSSLSEILNYFFRLARLDGKYFLCDTERLIKNATLLQNTSMSLKDLYVFCRTPIDMRGPFTGWAMLKFAGAHSLGKPMTIEHLKRILHWPLLKPSNPFNLMTFEERHDIVDLYLWLSMRFPDTFIAAEEARALQKIIQTTIGQWLVFRKQRPRRAVKGTDGPEARSHARHHLDYPKRQRIRKEEEIGSRRKPSTNHRRTFSGGSNPHDHPGSHNPGHGSAIKRTDGPEARSRARHHPKWQQVRIKQKIGSVFDRRKPSMNNQTKCSSGSIPRGKPVLHNSGHTPHENPGSHNPSPDLVTSQSHVCSELGPGLSPGRRVVEDDGNCNEAHFPVEPPTS